MYVKLILKKHMRETLLINLISTYVQSFNAY